LGIQVDGIPEGRTTMKRRPIVIVDDDEDLLQELEELLCAEGYDVKLVSDPLSAVGAIEAAAPYAVLLDLKMDKKDGFEIAGELAANPETSGIPVIVMTGYYEEARLERLKSSGVVRACLAKPLSVSDLVAKLDKVRG
jgi:twitching motility two-component system response regulator PilG